MANRITLRHGSTAPSASNLLPYELGWDQNTLGLYIGQDGAAPLLISSGGGGNVTGVKGSAEQSYRHGNVEITAANIGLGNVENTKLSTWSGSTNITTLGTITTGIIPWTRISGAQPSEASLTWGGKNFSGSYGCIDAAMIDDLGANRFAFLKAAGLTIEYSTDGGTTWLDYEASDTAKRGIFGAGQSFYLGKATAKADNTINNQLKITIATSAAGIYTTLNKIAIYMNTQGNTVQVKIEKALESTPTTFITHLDWTPISGWSGWNILNFSGITTYGNTTSSQYGRIALIFKQTAINSNYPSAIIYRILGFGGMGWTVPSNLARNSHLYSYDNSQNATFPAQITATQFNGPLNGNATSATKATQDGNGATISSTYLKLSGGTLTGVLTVKGSMYEDSYSGALNMNNSDIYGLNSIYTADASDTAAEGIHFYRDSTHVDTLWMSGGDILFVPNRALGTSTTKANSQKVGRFTTNPTTDQVVVTDGTTGGIKTTGYTIAKSVPSDALFTDTWNALSTSQAGYVVQAPNDTGKFLRGDATWAAVTATNVGLGNVSNSVNLNSTTGAKGDIIYWSAANTPAHLTNTSSTTKKFLSITSQVPSWTTLSNSDVGLGNVENTKLSTWTGSTAITTLGTIATGSIPLNNITSADNLKAIEALTGTTGFLKKTGVNQWTLDTNAGGTGGNGKIFYGTCSTAAATGEKAIVCDSFTSSDLTAGTIILVKFTNTNTAAASNLKLNINSTGANTIYEWHNGNYSSITNKGYLAANQVYEFIYNGTYWVVQFFYDMDTTYTFDGTYNASTNPVATVSTVTNAIGAAIGGSY